MIKLEDTALFHLGKIVATLNVLDSITPDSVIEGLMRHSQGD